MMLLSALSDLNHALRHALRHALLARVVPLLMHMHVRAQVSDSSALLGAKPVCGCHAAPTYRRSFCAHDLESEHPTPFLIVNDTVAY